MKKLKPVKQSIRWRIVLIYFLLVFIALSIVAVFITNRLESYQISALKDNIDSAVEESNLLSTLAKYGDLEYYSSNVQDYLTEGFSGMVTGELSVVSSNLLVCASTNESLVGRKATDLFDSALIVSCLQQDTFAESESTSQDGLAVKNFCYSIINENVQSPIGVLYVRADLSSLNSFMQQSQATIVKATVVALLASVLIGLILARSITEPINNVTENVLRMSTGDFRGEVPVRSNDEIGQLAEMFNLMRGKLDVTMSEISNEKSKLETILQYMADGLIAVDMEGNILHTNPAARKMLGVSDADNINDYNYDSLLGHLSTEMEFQKIKSICEKEDCDLTFAYNGLTFAVRCDMFKDDSGQSVGLIILLQDITERQKLEDMQTDFVANVSHELKTPLTNIKSYTETLIDGAMQDPETADKFLGIIDSEANRMNRLVKDLLQLSRLDRKQERQNIAEYNLIQLVEGCVLKVQLTAGAKEQQLNVLYDKTAQIKIMVDKDKMEQVILNILSNAIKYTQNGGRIDVDAYVKGDKACLIIADNGIGIPREQLPRIFERFYRVDKARSRAMGGTGLGLAITKQIVEEYNGTIEADSAEGQGTTMLVSLPLAVHRGMAGIE